MSDYTSSTRGLVVDDTMDSEESLEAKTREVACIRMQAIKGKKEKKI